MAKAQPQLSNDEKFAADQAANTLLEARKIEEDEKLHKNALNVIQTRKEIATRVLDDNK